MGGNNNYYYYNNNDNNNNNTRQKKSSSSSSFSMFGLFKLKKNRSRVEDYYGAAESEARSARSVWPSDDDKGRYWPVAEPGIDRKAEDFIAKIHRNIATDSERKTFTIPSTATTATAVAKA